MKRLLTLVVILGLLLAAGGAAYAAPPAQGGDNGNPAQDGGGDSGGGNDIGDALGEIGGAASAVINQIVRHILVFPVASMKEAVGMILGGLLQGSATQMAQPFYDILGATVLSNPGIRQDGTGIWQGTDIFIPTWNFTAGLAVVLWPAVLALMMIVAAKNVVLAADWGIGDFKEIFFNWVAGAIFSGLSLYIADLANRASNALTNAILGGSINATPAPAIDRMVNALTIGTLGVLSAGAPLVGIFIGFILLTLGFTLLMSLVFQYVARFALLYILVSLMPVVLILGILPPLRWLQWMFVRGLGMVLLIGPINALLLKMSGVIMGSAAVSATGPGAPIIRFIMAAGVVSVLLTVDFAIIKGVFGAVGMVVDKSTQIAKGVAAAGATVATAGVAGVGATNAALGAGGGFNLGALKSGLSAASAAKQQQAIEAGMSAAGAVLTRGRAGTAGRLLGAGMSGVRRAHSNAGRQAAQSDGSGGGGQGASPSPAQQQLNRQWERGESLAARRHGSVPPAAMHRASAEARQSVDKARQSGQSLPSMAQQAGYTGAGATDRFIAGRIESRLSAGGHLGRNTARAFRPDTAPGMPRPKDTPQLWDFDRGQQISDLLGLGEKGHTPMALVYHGLRAEAKTPDDGNNAAEGFYNAIGALDATQGRETLLKEAQSALETYGKQAGLDSNTRSGLKRWIK